MNELDYIAYLEALARLHTAIRHDPQINPAFFVVQDDNLSELETAMRSKLKYPCLLADEYIDEVLTDRENYRLRINGGFTVLCAVEKGNVESVRRARDQARQIARSIMHRIRRDCQGGGSLYQQRITISSEYPGEKAPTWKDLATGWAYTFEFILPTQIAVSADDWSDLP